MGETCAMCGLELASIETRNLYHSGEALKASDYRGKCLRDITCWQRGYDREKARADAANSKLAATDVERLQALSVLAAANARADAAETKRDELRGEAGMYKQRYFEKGAESQQWAAKAGASESALAAARRDIDAHKEALSDLMKLINDGALVRNIGQDGEPGWTLRAMRLVMALKHAYALVPDLAAPAPAPGEETRTGSEQTMCPHGRGSNESCGFCSVTGEIE